MVATKRVNGNNGNGLSLSDPNHPLNTVDINGNVIRKSPKAEAYDFVAHQQIVIDRKEAEVKELQNTIDKLKDLVQDLKLKCRDLELEVKLFNVRQPNMFDKVMETHGEHVIKGIFGVISNFAPQQPNIGSPDITNYDYIPNSDKIMECISDLNYIANQDPYFVENIELLKNYITIAKDSYLQSMADMRAQFKTS
jgi:hypothetical protein